MTESVHVGVRSFSPVTGTILTSMGFGDCIHNVVFAIASSIKREKLVLHIAQPQWINAKMDLRSRWAEAAGFFQIEIDFKFWSYMPQNEVDWRLFLRKEVGSVSFIFYDDFPGVHEVDEGIPISSLVCTLPFPQSTLLMDQREWLPKKFVTWQFDSSGIPSSSYKLEDARRLPLERINFLRDKILKMGYQIIPVGGEADYYELKGGAAALAAVYYGAAHFGLDSAFMHLAISCKPANKIFLYKSSFFGHHTLRAISCGASINNFDPEIHLV